MLERYLDIYVQKYVCACACIERRHTLLRKVRLRRVPLIEFRTLLDVTLYVQLMLEFSSLVSIMFYFPYSLCVG